MSAGRARRQGHHSRRGQQHVRGSWLLKDRDLNAGSREVVENVKCLPVSTMRDVELNEQNKGRWLLLNRRRMVVDDEQATSSG